MKKSIACAFLLVAWLPQAGGEPRDVVSPGITLLSPTPGQTVRPGESVTLELRPDSSLNADVMLVLSITRGSIWPAMQQINGPPFRTALAISPDTSGEVSFTALFRSTSGEFVGEAEITVLVIPEETPEEIQVSESSFWLDPPNPDGSFPDNAGSRRIRVRGIYPGQLTRDLTPAILGTTYTSSNTRIVTVTEDGVLKPVAPGLAYIIIENQGLRKFVEVVVEDPIRDSPPAVDRTNDVDIQLGRLMWRAVDDGVVLKQEVTITNKTALPLSWLSLVLDGLPENVRLVDDDGKTEVLQPLGSPYYDVLSRYKPFLLPGESVTVTPRFLPATLLPITYTPRIVSGGRP